MELNKLMEYEMEKVRQQKLEAERHAGAKGPFSR